MVAMSEDQELILKIVTEDDRSSFEILLKKYQGPIRSLFRRLCGGDAELANDLAQETFLKMYRGLAGFQGQAKVSTWLYSIAKNVYFEHCRRSDTFEELFVEESGRWSSADSQMDVAKAMLCLSADERLVLTLSYAEGLSQTEVAEVVGMPLGTVKTHSLRAKEKLKSILQPYKERAL